MRRKQIQFENDVYLALHELANDRMATFQELADEAFSDLLKKHHRPVGLAESLKQSTEESGKVVDMNSRQRIKRK
jgi:hypothetical protein